MQENHISTFLKQYTDDIDFMREYPYQSRGLSTGLRELDKTLKGLRAGELIIVGARPGMGKTGFAVTITRHIASQFFEEKDDKCVLYFNPSMSGISLAQRFVSLISNISIYQLNKPQSYAADTEAVNAAVSTLSKLPIYFSSDVFDIDGIKSEIEKMKKQHEIGFIVIDDLVSIQHYRLEDYTEFITNLKHIAIQLNVPIMVLAAVKRDCEEKGYKRPLLCDIKGFDKDQSAADRIIFLYREYYYLQFTIISREEDESLKEFKRREKWHEEACKNQKSRAEIIVSKNNFGLTRHIDVSYSWNTSEFKNLEE